MQSRDCDSGSRKRRESSSKETEARESNMWGRESVRESKFIVPLFTRVFGTAPCPSIEYNLNGTKAEYYLLLPE